MSQSGYTPIQLYRTTTASATPSAGNLSAGELAINLTDEKLFFKNASGTVKVLASTGAGNAGGSNTQVQYNSSGVLTGSSSFVFDGTNVGIGTSSPSYRLDVSGGVVGNTAGNSVSIGRLSGGAGSNSVQLLTTLNRISNGTDWTTTALRVQAQVDASLFGYIDFLNGSSAVMAFGRASSEFMRIDSSGNVGIGTSSPNYKVDVQTAANAEVISRVGSPAGSSAASTMLLTTGTTNSYAFMKLNDNTGSPYFSLGSGPSVSVAYYNFPTHIWTDQATERMRLTSSGNLGIGTSSPGAKLQVSAGASPSRGIAAILSSSVTGTQIQFTQGGVDDWAIGQPAGTSAFAFWSGRATGADGSERMRIDSSGNVGIGTTAPTTLLDVFSATAANLSVRGNSSTNITAHRSSTDAIGPNSVLRKSRGTSDSQTAVASGDTMGTLFFSAYGGTNNRNIASIAGVVDTYSTDASIGSYLTFSTTPNGSVTPAERMRITSTGGITSSDLADAVGYKGLPQNAQTSSYTLALSDMGKHISITTGGVVIPANASVAFPIGSAIAIYNNSGSNQTISITSDTLRQAGTANTGSRTLAQYGLCTVTKVASTTWVISGAGVS